MVNNSININKASNHLLSQILEYKRTHDIWHREIMTLAQACGKNNNINVDSTTPKVNECS